MKNRPASSCCRRRGAAFSCANTFNKIYPNLSIDDVFFPMLFTGVELRIKQHRGVRDVEVHNLAWNGVYLLREPAFIVPNMEKKIDGEI